MPENPRTAVLAVFFLMTIAGCSERRSVAPVAEDPPAATPETQGENSESNAVPFNQAVSAEAEVTAEPVSAD